MPFPNPPSSFEMSFLEAAQATKKDKRFDNVSNQQIQGTIVYCLDFLYPGHNFMHRFLTESAGEFGAYLTSFVVSELNAHGDHDQAQQVTELVRELAALTERSAQAQEVPAEPVDEMVESLNRLDVLYPGHEFTERFLNEPRSEFIAFLSSFGMSEAKAHGDLEQAQQVAELACELGFVNEQNDEVEPPSALDNGKEKRDYYAEDWQRHQ